MVRFSFDDLVRGITHSLEVAQRRLRLRQEHNHARYLEVDSNGNPRPVMFTLGTRDANGEDRATLDIPLLELLDLRPLSITELSVELDCAFKEQPGNPDCLVMDIKPWQPQSRVDVGIDKLKIRLTDRGGLSGGVYLNGVLFKELPAA